MARPKKKPDLKVVGGAQIGHNSDTAQKLDDDQCQALTRQHAAKRAELVAAEKKTKADRMNFDKIIKSDLGANGLADIKLLAELDTPEGEAKLKAEMERQFRVARWAGLPIGMQADMFGPDRRSVQERAAIAGKKSGMDGESLKPPYAPGTEGYDAYVEAWHVGQAALFAIKQKPADAPEVLRPEGNEPAGSDDFDAAADGSSGGGFAQDPGVEDAEGTPWPDDTAIAEREETDTL